jgi:hypothetical protein
LTEFPSKNSREREEFLEIIMKKFLPLFFLILSPVLIAQIPELSFWNNIRNSSYTLDDSIHVRCETIEFPGLETELYYWDQEWISVPMNYHLGLTYEGILPADYYDPLKCRFRTLAETLVVMMSAKVIDDFPPSPAEMAFIAPDPLGDNLQPDFPHLDITGNYSAFSENKLFSGITNESGAFPLNNGGLFPTTFFFYVTIIVNPENVLIDSVAYAMVYGNVPIFLQSGLYRINGTELNLNSFTQIGTVESQIAGNQLIVGCDLQTLTGDEFFGPWPNISNSLIMEMGTAVFSLPDVFSLSDFSTFSLQVFDQYIIEPFDNILPTISDAGFVINSVTSTVWFSYFDENGHFPLNCDLLVGNSSFQMLPTSFDYSQPVIFETTFPLTEWDQATIVISDNGYEFVEETIFNNTSISEILFPEKSFRLSNYPNPFNLSGAGNSSATTISLSSADTADLDEFIQIEIYNLKGQKVKTLPVFPSQSNSASIMWDGTNQDSQPVSSGIYFARIKAGNYEASTRMLLLR